MAQSYRVECPPSHVRCVLIADDLTGACDAAAPFRAQGASARVLFDFVDETEAVSDVTAVSTDSRDLPVREMKDRLYRIAAKLAKVQPGIVFKKIDSTLRGHPGQEIATALDAFRCEVAVITPAFPEMGRHVRDEFLFSDRDPAWQPVHVQTLLRAQGLENCEHVTSRNLRSVLAGGPQFVSLAAACEEDLETIVYEALRCGRRVLWAGSAGLASALARAVFPGSPTHSQALRPDLPLLFAIGSNHVVTGGQVDRLSTRFATQSIDADTATPEMFAAALCSHRHTILNIGRSTTNSERLATLLRGSERLIGALLLSGGDTASLVCQAIEAQVLRLEGEIVTGLPWGILEGGLLDKVPVATKSGAFGAPDALIKVADFFACLTR